MKTQTKYFELGQDDLNSENQLNPDKKLNSNKTLIMITHKLNGIKHYDKIIVMKKGEIIEEGKHMDLLKKNGEYKKLYELELLKKKLKPNGKIFIDTPCTFWLYPVTKFFSKRIHAKLLKGTVDADHQQIWSTKSFFTICHKAELSVLRFKKLSEYTQSAEFYLDNMGIKNTILKLFGKIFFRLSPVIARNKIMAVIG